MSNNTNGRKKPQPDTGTVHLRIPTKIINLIRRQAKDVDPPRTINAHAGFLLRKAAEFYERQPNLELLK